MCGEKVTEQTKLAGIAECKADTSLDLRSFGALMSERTMDNLLVTDSDVPHVAGYGSVLRELRFRCKVLYTHLC